MGTGSEPPQMLKLRKNAAGSVPVPFFGRVEKGTGTEPAAFFRSFNIRGGSEPVPIFHSTFTV